MTRTSGLPRQQSAAVLHAAGDLRVERRPVPQPGPGEALVRIAAVGICGSDVAYVNGTAKYEIQAPLVMGHEASGVVEAVGSGPVPTHLDGQGGGNAEIVPGSRVALSPGFTCATCELCTSGRDNLCAEVRYLGSAAAVPHVEGALQEFLVLPVANLLPLPESVSLEVAALLEPLAVAHHAVQRTDVMGRSVLITGGGAIGQLLALVARAMGADSVTVSETIAGRRRSALAHGANHALDPEETAGVVESGERFDVVFDASGRPAALETGLRAVNPAFGRVILVGNLPAGYGLAAHSITRAESWVTATLRFPGGLAPALDFLLTHNLDIEWLVEHSTDLAHVQDAFDAAQQPQAPLKVQVTP